jgi:hypothetical protein
MTTTFSTASLRKPFSYILKDPKWKIKLLIYMGITLTAFIIPVIPGLIMMGYSYQIMRSVIKEDGEPALPEWTEWGKLLADGWRLFCVTIIYSLPLIIIQAIVTLLYFGYIFSIPLMAQNNNEGLIIAIMFGFMAIIFLALGIAIFLSIILVIVLPPAMCHTVAKDSFKAGFRIREWWKIFRANLGGFMLVLLLLAGLYAVLMLTFQFFYVTLVLWCLMPFILIIGGSYLSLVMNALFALVYREGMEKLGIQNG